MRRSLLKLCQIREFSPAATFQVRIKNVELTAALNCFSCRGHSKCKANETVLLDFGGFMRVDKGVCMCTAFPRRCTRKASLCLHEVCMYTSTASLLNVIPYFMASEQQLEILPMYIQQSGSSVLIAAAVQCFKHRISDVNMCEVRNMLTDAKHLYAQKAIRCKGRYSWPWSLSTLAARAEWSGVACGHE